MNRVDNYRIPFGKYKGELLSDIPVDYLDWLIGAEFMQEKPDLRKVITDHLKTRPEWEDLDDE